jgi:hypothetical protein
VISWNQTRRRVSDGCGGGGDEGERIGRCEITSTRICYVKNIVLPIVSLLIDLVCYGVVSLNFPVANSTLHCARASIAG